jgi:methionyl-tRNA formyltransferase
MVKASILIDDFDSWIVPFGHELKRRLKNRFNVELFFKAFDIPDGDFLFILGCTSIVPIEILSRNTLNLVVHESNLPKGRGNSPVAWQVLEEKSAIPIVIFEATQEMDAGPIYLKDRIELDGTELLTEIRQKQGEKTVELIIRFLERWPNITPAQQRGTPTYYRKRTVIDDALNPEKSIIDNFNHLRIVDNERYPARFQHKGQWYIVKIFKDEQGV